MAAYCAAGDKSGTVTPARLAKVPASAQHVYTAARETPQLYTGAPPTRAPDGTLHFTGFPAFRPNLTPEEVLRGGAFGGSYFRCIASGVTGKVEVEAWRELPAAWRAGLSVARLLASPTYSPGVNKFGVRSGQDLRDWEGSGWIDRQDPLGWFQWFTRFYQGRRSHDDERQLGRWGALAGAKGRWKRNLIAKVVAAGRAHSDASVSPVVRQTLWHWGYQLTQQDCEAYAKSLKAGARAPYLKAPAQASSSGGGGASSGSSGSKRRGGGSEEGAGASAGASAGSAPSGRPKKRGRSE